VQELSGQDRKLEQAVVLAGGLGTRLGALSAQVPKSLAPLRGRPFLEYQLRLLAGNGISEILLLTGHLGDQIEAVFGSGQALELNIQYSREETPQGTAGALALAAPRLLPDFFLVYGDSLLDLDYQAAARACRNLRPPGAAGLMAVCPVDLESDFLGNAKLDPTGSRVISYAKAHGGDHDHVDAGVLVLTREVTAWIPQGRPAALEECVYPRLASEGRLVAYRSPAKFYDIGTPDRLAQFERVIASSAREDR